MTIYPNDKTRTCAVCERRGEQGVALSRRGVRRNGLLRQARVCTLTRYVCAGCVELIAKAAKGEAA